MAFFDDLFHPSHAYNKAADVMRKYYEDAQKQLDYYNQGGQRAGSNLEQQSAALSNPAQLYSDWAKTYETSPAAQQSIAQSNQQGLDAASQMGLLGSSAALNNIQSGSHNLMEQDRQAYMKDLMDKYLASIGINTSMYGTGAGAAGQQSQNAMTQGQNAAGLQFGADTAGTSRFGALGKFGIEQLLNYLTRGQPTQQTQGSPGAI